MRMQEHKHKTAAVDAVGRVSENIHMGYEWLASHPFSCALNH